MNKLKRFFLSLLSITMREQWSELYSSKTHSDPIKFHRAVLLKRRTLFFSLLFGITVPAWSLVDYALLPFELWLQLAVFRALSGGIFFAIANSCDKSALSLNQVLIRMVVMFMIPTVFFLLAEGAVSGYELTGFSGALIKTYSLLPFIVIASLVIFTLTIKELLLITIPITTITIWSLYPESNEAIPNAFMLIWLFFLLVFTSFVSSISQMSYMISQVTRASYDTLTRVMSRRAGVESLELFFRMSSLQSTPLSVLFIDIDNFKELNDSYGHDKGDKILVKLVKALNHCIRKGDTVIRWGGEEFLVLLPFADHSDSKRVIDRIIQNGLGLRPDGTPLTVSMGLAEKERDDIAQWEDLVTLADQRMYKAKELGKARCVGCEQHSVSLVKTEN